MSSKRPESDPPPLLVTMALPYANGDIHLGHLVEAVQTDVFVRFNRLIGRHVVYVCADDTHGTPIELSALKKGISPEQMIAEIGKNHVRDYQGFSISFDIFYSTNSPENRRYAELIFQKLRDNNLIVEREIVQYYCEHDKRFLPDRFIKGICPRCKAPDQYGDVCEVCGSTYDPSEVEQPRCALCGNTPVRKASTHFFVELDKRRDFLRDYLNNHQVLREDMRNFVNGWIDGGLKEWCISRDGPYFGFRIPGTENKFFYVWLDAPIGYLSSTEKWCAEHQRRTEEFWGKDSGAHIVHFIGKDIVYFHSLFWPVMLDSAQFNLPHKIVVHGFLTVNGEKMSKSRGTFLLARDFLDKVKHPQASEYLRFYFAAKLADTASDIDLNADDLRTRVNTTLANNIGNLHHRTFVFCDRYFGSRIPDAPWDEAIAAAVAQAAKDIERAYANVEYKSVMEAVHSLGNLGNKYYQDGKPWELVSTDPQRAATIMVTCANLIKALGVFLKPIVPNLVSQMEQQYGRVFSWEDHVFSLRDHAMNATTKLVRPLEPDDLSELFAQLVTAPRPAPAEPFKEPIEIESFAKVDLRIGTIEAAELVKKSQKLLKLQVRIGEHVRQIIAGIAKHYDPANLTGKQVVVVANLKPATLMGERSEGMVLAASSGESLILLQPEQQALSGSRVS